MNILGISVSELLLIILIAVVILGPKDIKNTAKTVGQFLRKVTTSPEWRAVNDATKALKTLPATLMREDITDADPIPARSVNSDNLPKSTSANVETENNHSPEKEILNG